MQVGDLVCTPFGSVVRVISITSAGSSQQTISIGCDDGGHYPPRRLRLATDADAARYEAPEERARRVRWLLRQVEMPVAQLTFTDRPCLPCTSWQAIMGDSGVPVNMPRWGSASIPYRPADQVSRCCP